MTIRIAINGFGRIGRSLVRALYESGKNDTLTVVAINELAPTEGIAHLLKYDTTHGRFPFPVTYDNDSLIINDLHGNSNNISVSHVECLTELPWQQNDVDIVIDCTGKFGSYQDGLTHLKQGQRKSYFLTLAVKT